ncbi:carbamate kinase [candidate division WOR-3 bacterium]|nr:carbamate kinase [candidate division WOR-3 bacterium]
MTDKPIAIVALGGNALIREGQKGTIYEQFANTRASLSGIIHLIENGYSPVITHGNGPQAGHELLRNERCADEIPPQPLGVIDASTQGWIGYMIAQSLYNRLLKENIKKTVTPIVTQIIVSPDDPSIKNPTKPVGVFYRKEDVPSLEARGWVVKEDSGRGYRRVVPSPKPLSVVEKDAILSIINKGGIVIAAGGGGIPVYYLENGALEGMDAVIDKDRASAVLGAEIGAELLVILTGVEKVAINFRKQGEKFLDRLDIGTAKKYLFEGQFPPGSMGPKIEAAIDFLEKGGKKVIITDLDKAREAFNGKTGTILEK